MNITPILKHILNISLGLLLIACATTPTSFETKSHVAPAYDLSKLKTFSWIESAKGSVPLLKNTALIQSYAPIVIENTLKNKGYSFVKDPAKSDFVVSYHVTTVDRVESSEFAASYGMSAETAAAFAPDQLVYTQGTLVIDFLSVDNKIVVWRGTASTPITPGYEPTAAKEILDGAVAAVLKQFPSRN